MEEEVAALVRAHDQDQCDRPHEHRFLQVIDNGSGMCKAGCESRMS